jgi:hypothetical protein
MISRSMKTSLRKRASSWIAAEPRTVSPSVPMAAFHFQAPSESAARR